VEEPEEASDGPSAPPDPDWPGTQDDSVQYPLNQGRGWYTTSDGQRVHGKKNALEAQAALDSQGDA
jgi:hypothetical protein